MGRILTVADLGEYLKKLPQGAEISVPGGRDYFWRLLTDDTIAVEYPVGNENDEAIPKCQRPRSVVYFGRSPRPCGREDED